MHRKSVFATETRGYTLSLETDLLGDPVIFRRWYGLRTRRGGGKRQVFTDMDAAIKEFQRVERARIRRGYSPVC